MAASKAVKFGQHLKELRIHLCQKSAGSKGARFDQLMTLIIKDFNRADTGSHSDGLVNTNCAVGSFMMNVLHINVNEYLVTDIGGYMNEQYSHSNCSMAESFSGKLIIYVRRDFLEQFYVPLKQSNPKFPILVRECSGIQPMIWARYDLGREVSVPVADKSSKEVLSTVEMLAQKTA